jgi:hypothetical protein
MERAKTSWCFLFSCAASCATAATPLPIDRPTPPPCAADGTCYPSEGTWGWYPCKWRQWPGEVLVPTPAGAQPTPAELQKGGLGPFETPTPEREDTQAPPSTAKKTETKAGTGEGESTNLEPEGGAMPPRIPREGVSAPPQPPQEGPAGTPRGYSAPNIPTPNYPTPNIPTPNYPTPYKPAPAQPSPMPTRPTTGDADPPPALPWASNMRAPATTANAVASRQAGPIGSRQGSDIDDAPPAVPSVFHSAGL